MPVWADFDHVPAGTTPYSASVRPFPLVTRMRSAEELGFSSYQGLQLEAERRFHRHHGPLQYSPGSRKPRRISRPASLLFRAVSTACREGKEPWPELEWMAQCGVRRMGVERHSCAWRRSTTAWVSVARGWIGEK